MWFQNQRPILWGCLQIIIKCAWELRSCYREITEFEFSHSGTLSRPSLESHQTPLGSLLSGSQRGLTGPVDYHVHGSPPGNHIKQRSRLSEFGLWFSHGLAGFISWAGGRMKRDGGGSCSFELMFPEKWSAMSNFNDKGCINNNTWPPISDRRIMGSSGCCWLSWRMAILSGFVLMSLLITKNILPLTCKNKKCFLLMGGWRVH